MRAKRTVQCSIFEHYAEHDIGRELKAMSHWLDEHDELLDIVAADIQSSSVMQTGRKGLTVETVLRCGILKQYRQLSYEELAFFLMDSTACESFARLPVGVYPKKAALQKSISLITVNSWEQINQCLLRSAAQTKIERGQMLRIDSTVTDTPIHEPSDSQLLLDSVRVMIRLLKQAEELSEGIVDIVYHNHYRRAKKRARAIHYTRGMDKKTKLYKDLIDVTQKTQQYLLQAYSELQLSLAFESIEIIAWQQAVDHYLPLIQCIIDQTQRRVFTGESVPAAEKIVSLFEEHTDIIVKGSRDVQYGHKLNLSTGKSGLILDMVIESGNPADSEQLIPMLERHIDHYGKAPRQMAADGGYASVANLESAKALQVKDVAFHKKRGLKVEDMAKSPWVYRKLRNFRAGIEAGISCMKRVYGLGRCTWKGLAHFKAYIWSSVVAHNLALFGRLLATSSP